MLVVLKRDNQKSHREMRQPEAEIRVKKLLGANLANGTHVFLRPEVKHTRSDIAAKTARSREYVPSRQMKVDAASSPQSWDHKDGTSLTRTFVVHVYHSVLSENSKESNTC